MILAEKVLDHLRETGTSRKDFAQIADIPLSTLNSFLNGKIQNPTYFTAIQLARAAGISLDAIGGITSPDMGAEEIRRIRTEYQQHADELTRTLAEHTAKIAHQAEQEAHDKEIIRRQDIHMQELNDRISYQKKAITIHRILIFAFAAYGIAVTWLLLS